MRTFRSAMRVAAVSGLLAAALPALATLPPPTEEAQAKAAAAAAKTAWASKVQAYKLCEVEDHLAESYRKNAQGAGKTVQAALPTPPCTDPGPFAVGAGAATPKPIEASEAHSPAATATSPPSSNTPAAEIPASGNK